ncbi:MAG TPA: ABC transporter substrate-binding protein [Acidimicrobiales bacterium]
MRHRFGLLRARLAISTLAASVLLGLVLVSVGGSVTTSAGAATGAPGVTAKTVKVGIISDLTGAASSTFADSAPAMEARYKQLNAAGGVDGRKITWSLSDSTSAPAGAATAAKELVQSQNVFMISEVSALLFAAAAYLNQAGVPVTGSSLDGPEWYQQPNTNMFNISGNDSPSEPGYTDGGFWKAIGAKKISFIASNTPSSTRGLNPFNAALKQEGLQSCDNTVVPLGGVSFTTYALSFKTAGCDAAECSCVLSSSLAVSTSLQQEGLSDVKVLYGAGPSNQIFANSADEAAGNGAYFLGTNYANAAGKVMLAGLKKYDPAYKGGIPDLGTEYGWEVANLTIEGLQATGKNLTRAGYISALRGVTNWTDEGLAPSPINLKDFGQAPATTCTQYVQFVNKKYVPFPKSGKPFCGKLIPGSGTPQ